MAAPTSSSPIRSLISHERRDVGRESCHKDKGGGVFYYLPLDRSFFAVCMAFLAQGIFDGHTTPIANVAVPH